ncbi:glycosyltransferase family 2 protein [Nitrosomonas sp. Is35]|uniref:glycosyltransferase family 2 protein n=1 Tax=Nitrosomonas sp. Is35 TaxID=3080534 RepID=UPI00294B397C|nr:glycosyltransferase family 2 protein [Nitrosomonas sp. Is35]MDV6346187.1 glycosyltransferase family 2 protein [Nitrosomonas sp. Is35]
MHAPQQICHDIKERCTQPITVIIVNYNAGRILTQCVQAVLQQVQQVLVIDNASSDSSLSELESSFAADNHLQIVRLNSNAGFAAGCNTGLSAATQPYMLFLNPDCILQENSLQRMLRVMESDPRIGMIGGYLVNPDGSEQGGGRRAIPTPWRAFVRAIGLHRLEKYWPRLFFDFHLDKQPLPQAPIEVEAISGALMLVRRQAIDDVGPWDEHYFLHCEDLDWCMRFKQKNWKIVFVPDAPVVHFQGTCSRARPYFVSWHKHKGMLRFYRKFFRQRYPGILMGLITLGVWLRFSATVLVYAAQNCYRTLKFKHE